MLRKPYPLYNIVSMDVLHTLQMNQDSRTTKDLKDIAMLCLVYIRYSRVVKCFGILVLRYDFVFNLNDNIVGMLQYSNFSG